jgi:hypothetical protein
MAIDDPIDRALADLAKADRAHHAPPHLESAVLAAFDRRQERGYLRRCAAAMWQRRGVMASSAAAVSVIAMIYLAWPQGTVDSPLPEPVVQVQADRGSTPAPAAEPIAPSPTAALPAARPRLRPDQRVERGPARAVPTWRQGDEVMQTVHMRMPRSMLSMLGVPVIEPGADGTVNVELVLGTDGIARTVRIIP